MRTELNVSCGSRIKIFLFNCKVLQKIINVYFFIIAINRQTYINTSANLVRGSSVPGGGGAGGQVNQASFIVQGGAVARLTIFHRPLVLHFCYRIVLAPCTITALNEDFVLHTNNYQKGVGPSVRAQFLCKSLLI